MTLDYNDCISIKCDRDHGVILVDFVVPSNDEVDYDCLGRWILILYQQIRPTHNIPAVTILKLTGVVRRSTEWFNQYFPPTDGLIREYIWIGQPYNQEFYAQWFFPFVSAFKPLSKLEDIHTCEDIDPNFIKWLKPDSER